MSRLMSNVCSLWRGVFHRAAIEQEMKDEFAHHIELRARDLEATGLSAAQALTQARREFGLADRHKEDARASRGLGKIDAIRFSWLDVKLGARMMLKYPGLTVVAGLGIAVAIAISVGYGSVIRAMLDAPLPLPDGDRVVALQNWDIRRNARGETSARDLVVWRDQLRQVEHAGAYRTIVRNLVSDNGSAEPITLAELSASGFDVAGVAPWRGRFLRDEDELPGAPEVIVIGYDEWVKRFGSDPNILDRKVRLGSTIHAIVGVMPPKFAFPVSHHYWIPFRDVSAASVPNETLPVTAFARLNRESTVDRAQAEIEVLGARMAREYPETHADLRAQVQLYTRPITGMDNPDDVSVARTAPLLTTVLLLVICVNVAVLIYARTAVRHGEIVVRTALGASRSRVITQLFAEALVLALAAAVMGLAIAGFALHKANELLALVFGGQLPFWMNLQLSLGSVVYAVGLAVFAAVITGVVPALRATGSRMRDGLQQLSAGGGSMQLGKIWTALIVGQVALTVALLPVAVFQTREMLHFATVEAGFEANTYVSSVVGTERDDGMSKLSRYNEQIRELSRVLRNESGVSSVTFASSIPGKELYIEVEIENVNANGNARTGDAAFITGSTRFTRVDPGLLSAFDVPLLAGRTLASTDADTAAATVLVNKSFAERYFPNGDVLGKRIRRARGAESQQATAIQRREPWLQIVGVVADFPVTMIPEQIEAKIYEAGSPASMYPATILIGLRKASDATVAAQLRRIAAAVDPTITIQQVQTLQAVYDADQSAFRLMGIGIALVTLSVLLLSSAGIYAMMSLSVTQRRREIGIRAALGANARNILTRVFAQAATKLGVGIAFGLLAAGVVDALALHGALRRDPAVVVIVLSIIAAVGMLASLGPARKGLRIAPSEALKQE